MAARKPDLSETYIQEAQRCLEATRKLADREARCVERERVGKLLKLIDADSHKLDTSSSSG
jgi:hypothetical protein